jgi:hypothetical protein
MRTLVQAILIVSMFGGVVLLSLAAMVRSITGNKEPRKRVHTLILSKDNREIIGDGAWSNTPAVFPSERLRRLREIEPRGV